MSQVMTLNDQNWIKKVMQNPQSHLLVLLESLSDCPQCRKYGKPMAHLAKATDGSP